MHEVELSPAEERFADTLLAAFEAVQSVVGTKSAARFVVDTARMSDEIVAEAQDAEFLREINIDPYSWL